MIAAGTLARSRAFAARRETTAVVGLGGLVAVSAVVRVVVAQLHTAPRYWPDEYVYAAISRSLAHGHLEVRDQPAQFYAILQPIVAAPLWRFFPAHEAYRLIQVENAVAASLVVIPLWFLGRELRLSRLTIYLVCVYALLVPTLALIPVTISDFIAYPLAISAVAVAVRSLNEPTRGRQIAFLCFAALATVARIQYVVLVPAYLAAAFLLDRRRAHREHAWVFLALLPAFGGALLAITGYYEIGSSSFRPSMVTWMLLQCFLLSLTAGVAIVPGAVAAFLRPTGRAEKAFAAFAGVFILLVLAEASQPAAAEGRYKERYLLTIVPLLAIAFGLHMRNRRSHRLIVPVVSVALMIAAAQLPLSGYTFNALYYDSQTLDAAWLLQRHAGASTSSLLLALFVTVGAALAVAACWRARIGVVALPLSIAFMVGVTVVDRSHRPRPQAQAVDPAWIDEAVGGAHVTAVATPASARLELIRQLYWNASVDREVLLDGSRSDRHLRKDRGQPRPGRASWRASTATSCSTAPGHRPGFAGATTKATRGNYALFEGRRPRFRVLVENQLSTGWLSPYSRLRAWPATRRARPSSGSLSRSHPGARVASTCVSATRLSSSDSGSALHLTCRSIRWPFKLLLALERRRPGFAGQTGHGGLTTLTVGSGACACGRRLLGGDA